VVRLIFLLDFIGGGVVSSQDAVNF
jgi:hypothetical protein